MKRRILLPVGAALALVLGACSDSTGPADDGAPPQLNADVAAMAADAVGEDVDIMRDPNFRFHIGFVAPPGGFHLFQCDYDAASGWFLCPDVTVGPLTLTRTFQLRTVLGDPMDAWDEEQTAEVQVISSMAGSINREFMEASISRDRDYTVSGLQGNEQTRTWNGTGEDEVERSLHRDGGPTRTYDMSASAIVDDVVVPHFNNQNMDPWPLSGSITREVTVTWTRDGETRTHTRTVVVTFDGTQFATLTVTGPNGTETFEVDLAERRSHRRP